MYIHICFSPVVGPFGRNCWVIWHPLGVLGTAWAQKWTLERATQVKVDSFGVAHVHTLRGASLSYLHTATDIYVAYNLL